MFFTVTLPMIWDVFVVALVLWVIGSLKIFDLIAATTFPAPPTSTYTLTIYIWSQAVGTYTPVYRLGYATALGVVLLVMVVISVGITRLVTRKEAIEY
jgi:raffinose/stachyose/melibiose transport system permease protein